MSYSTICPENINKNDDLVLEQKKGQLISGFPIGVVFLETWYPIVPGNVCHAGTYDFPVLFQKIEGGDPQKIYYGDSSLLAPIIEAARKLEKQGVRAIAGACGYLGHYQTKVAEAIEVPVFLSSLLQLPLIHLSLNPKQKIGVLCATESNFSSNLLRECGALSTPFVSAGLEHKPEFRNITYSLGKFDYRKLENEVVESAFELIKNNPDVGAMLLECSDMPPFAYAVQEAIKMPVFDFITMIKWVHSSVVQKPYCGIF